MHWCRQGGNSPCKTQGTENSKDFTQGHVDKIDDRELRAWAFSPPPSTRSPLPIQPLVSRLDGDSFVHCSSRSISG